MTKRLRRSLIGGGLILAGAGLHFVGFIFMSALGWSTKQQDVLENLLGGLLFAHPLYVMGVATLFLGTRFRRWASAAIVLSLVELIAMAVLQLLAPILWNPERGL